MSQACKAPNHKRTVNRLFLLFHSVYTSYSHIKEQKLRARVTEIGFDPTQKPSNPSGAMRGSPNRHVIPTSPLCVSLLSSRFFFWWQNIFIICIQHDKYSTNPVMAARVFSIQIHLVSWGFESDPLVYFSDMNRWDADREHGAIFN